MTSSNNPLFRNLLWQQSFLTREDREKQLGQRGAVIWLTGYSGAGKSTLAMKLEKTLFDRGAHAFVLDGDNIRQGLNANLGFSPEDRVENIRRVGEAAKLLAEAGLIVIAAFISPYELGRKQVRERIGASFIEVYVDCPLTVCEKRDAKGLYKKARAGNLPDFTGISAPYEPPQSPEIHLDSEKSNPEECAGKIMTYLVQHGFITTGDTPFGECPLIKKGLSS